MKRMRKIFLGMIMAMALCMIPAVSAEAADGFTMDNANLINLGQNYTKVWNQSTDNKNAFYKFVVPSAGKVTFSFNYPKINTGEYETMNLQLYDSSRTLIWEFDGKASEVNPQVLFWLGLEKGTYYINLDYDGTLYSHDNETSATTNFNLAYEQSTLCETESNNRAATADTLALNLMYDANACDHTKGEDWYQFYLQKGQTYYINIGNFEEFDQNTNCLWDFYLPNGDKKSLKFKYNVNEGNIYSAEYTATSTGVHYFKVWNTFSCWGELPNDYQIGISTSKNINANAGKTGLAQAADGNWYYYVNGKINSSYTGLVQFAGNWWYVEKGAVRFTNTLVPYGGQWWYVKNGAVNFSTGMVQYGGQWWYVKNGAVSFTTTLVPFAGNWWYVKNGAVSFTNTLVQYGGSWWYVKNGAVSFTTTLVPFAGKWWYVKNGAVDFSYSGKVPYAGKYWNVKNGVVVF